MYQFQLSVMNPTETYWLSNVCEKWGSGSQMAMLGPITIAILVTMTAEY